MTEGNGHVIDPDGEARRALHAAVAEHGPQALSNAVIMDGICRARLGNLPGEATLIGSAARADVPALLRDLIPHLGNYGAIQSAATTLAETHGLDTAACVWVVREFARALGLIAAGGTQPAARMPGVPGVAGVPVPGGPVPGGAARRKRVPGRDTVGVAAAIVLVAGYLGVAAVAHLSPFPARTVAAASSPPASPRGGASPSPAGSPDPSPDPDPSPTSDYQILLSRIPSVVQGTNNCHNVGTSVGATAVSECTGLHGLAAATMIYYLFPDRASLGSGFSNFLTKEKFRKESACSSTSNFTDFVAQCESDFTSQSPAITGSIAEYANTSNQPIIVTSDTQQRVMVVMIGTNDGALLAYWKQLRWVVT